MNEKKLSEQMCSLIEQAIRHAIRIAAELRENFRLDVRVHPVAILDGQPLCVSLRLIATQQGVGRNTVYMLKDKWSRIHVPEIIMMESPNKEDLCVMYNAEYAPSAEKTNQEWNRFSKTVKYPVVRCEKHQSMLIKMLVDFLTSGLIEGRPYQGYVPA